MTTNKPKRIYARKKWLVTTRQVLGGVRTRVYSGRTEADARYNAEKHADVDRVLGIVPDTATP